MPGFKETVQRMADSLIEVAEQHDEGVQCLVGLTTRNFNCFLDDTFNDGGEVRCERFCDLAWPYALQFGNIDSEGFDDARAKCHDAAIEEVIKRLKRMGLIGENYNPKN